MKENMTLWEKAELSVNTPGKLRKRLRMSAGALKKEFSVLFPLSAEFKVEGRQLLSSCGRYVLQWTNKGTSSIGTVYLIVRSASLGATTGV